MYCYDGGVELQHCLCPGERRCSLYCWPSSISRVAWLADG